MTSRTLDTHYSKTFTDLRSETEKNRDDLRDWLGFDIENPGSETPEEVLAMLDATPAAADIVSNEVTASAAPLSNEVTAACPKPLSNKVTAAKRRSDLKDRKELERIRNFRLPPAPAASLPLVHPHTPSNSPHPSDTLPTPTARSKRQVTSWDHTSDRMKLAAATLAMQVWEGATSWTFNLTPEAEKLALSHPRGFVGSLSRAFNRAAKRRLGYVPEYLFSADVTKQGRLHLHGAIRCDASLLPVLRAVMVEAWGAWKGRGADNQLLWNPERCDDGWPDYFLQARRRVTSIIGEHTYVITKELRRMAKFTHGQIREVISSTENVSQR